MAKLKHPGRRAFLTPENKPIIAEQLYGENMTYKAVAELHGCAATTLKKYRVELQQCYEELVVARENMTFLDKVKQSFR